MRKFPALVIAVLGAAVTLTACNSDSGDGDGELSASGEFGDKPEITVPSGDPSEELVVEVLSQGDGAEVASGDFLVVNYLGQTWEPRDPADIPSDDPTEPTDQPTEEPTEEPAATEDAADSDGSPVPYIFDNSYDRGEPVGFNVGVGQLIPGWDEGLVGQQVGSRVLLSIPPDKGYGGQEGHDLAEDTLVFVVDIIDAFNVNSEISGEPVSDLPDDLPTVTGEGADEPVVEFPASAEPVSESTTDLLIAGDGADLGENLVVKALEVSYATGENGYSSWAEGQVTVINVQQIPGLLEALEGQKAGSRVLVRIAPADNVTEESPDGEPIAIVVDIVGSY
ncbi:MAG TPA: FKBP-type peptidyl-prolyl cis-trans isomerase [Jiangellaceae bacterium]|nr:FKBP-type peptidyl-prolyl cis-trans isomerase [Jiangellaceae bacterium]